MQQATFSRRWFIGGAAAFGAFSGCRFMRAPHDFASGRPNLRFGVVSDIHIANAVSCPEPVHGRGNAKTFRHTLEWFRDQGADGVVIAGDMADQGLVAQLEAVAETWRAVFPDDRAPDGRKVEKLFVYGNHDMGGLPYAKGGANALCRALKGKTDAEYAPHMIITDPKAVWEKVFDEAYEPIWSKEVNGYRFVGAHWLTEGCRGKDEKFNDRIGDFYAENGGSFDPALPFFHIQHPHPKDTCYGPWAWGRDIGNSTQALSAFPNAVAFSGHSHYSLTDERSVWQGAFTSVGTSSLMYNAYAYEEFEDGYENTRANGKDGWRVDARKFSPVLNGLDCRQGMLWSVYDDCLTVRRREFLSDLDLGPDWVLPLPAAEAKPFAFAERAKKLGVPQFAPDAKLEIVRTKARNRGGQSRDKKQSVPAASQDVVELRIPPVKADPSARVNRYTVTAFGADGKSLTKRILAEGFHHGLKHPRAAGMTPCRLAVADLPSGAVTIRVSPENSFGVAGKPLLGIL